MSALMFKLTDGIRSGKFSAYLNVCMTFFTQMCKMYLVHETTFYKIEKHNCHLTLQLIFIPL